MPDIKSLIPIVIISIAVNLLTELYKPLLLPKLRGKLPLTNGGNIES